MDPTGLEPVTSWLWVRHSNQLNYRSVFPVLFSFWEVLWCISIQYSVLSLFIIDVSLGLLALQVLYSVSCTNSTPIIYNCNQLNNLARYNITVSTCISILILRFTPYSINLILYNASTTVIVIPIGLEPITYSLENCFSIQLS